MPRFYFDTIGGGQIPIKDEVGHDFPSLSEAQAHSMSLLPLLGVEPPLREGEFRTWTATIRDDQEEIVCRFVLAIINDKVGLAAERWLKPST